MLTRLDAALDADGYSSEVLSASLARILGSTTLCSVATGHGGDSSVCTVFFCYDSDLNLYFLSDPGTTHARNIGTTGRAAVAVYDSAQVWGDDLHGVQLVGESRQLTKSEERAADHLYRARFPGYADYWDSLGEDDRRQFPSRYFVVRPSVATILDEERFGEEVFVTASIRPS